MDEVPRAFAIYDIQSSAAAMKGRVYNSCVRSSMTYGSETRPLIVDVGLKFERAEMQMDVGCLMKDRTRVELRRMVEVEPITAVIRSGRLKTSWKTKDMVRECSKCIKPNLRSTMKMSLTERNGEGML